VDYDIVAVSVNYRLGPLGFLSLPRDTIVTGNQVFYLRKKTFDDQFYNFFFQGIRDQTIALQWVHDNIAAFGGDPNKVNLINTCSSNFTFLRIENRSLLVAKVLEVGV